jgi:hypothetical protein
LTKEQALWRVELDFGLILELAEFFAALPGD